MDISRLKRNLGRIVKLGDTEYKLKKGIITLDENNEYYYQAELQDLTALRSTLICALKDVDEIN
jgi:hypothetical protein